MRKAPRARPNQIILCVCDIISMDHIIYLSYRVPLSILILNMAPRALWLEKKDCSTGNSAGPNFSTIRNPDHPHAAQPQDHPLSSSIYHHT